jgi:hypothetical protein
MPGGAPQQRGVPISNRGYTNLASMGTNNSAPLRSSIGGQQIQMGPNSSVIPPNQNTANYNPSAEILGLLQQQPKSTFQTPNGNMAALRDSSSGLHHSNPNLMVGHLNMAEGHSMGMGSFDMMDFPLPSSGGRTIGKLVISIP